MGQDKCLDNRIYEAEIRAVMAALRHLCPDPEGKRVLLLCNKRPEDYLYEALEKLGISEISEDLQEEADLILNTDPDIGKSEGYEKILLKLALSSENRPLSLLDLTRTELRTDIVLEAKERGILAEGSLFYRTAKDLFLKAEDPFSDVTADRIAEAFKKEQRRLENIVLTGMPGAGKSAAGEAIARALNRKFIDSDAAIIERSGREIADIFAKEGEACFRKMETEIILELSENQGMVFSTGGGTILRKENVRALKKNGKIYFLDRPLEYILPSDDRPLSDTADKVVKLYRERYDLYLSTSDEVLIPGSEVEKTVGKILKEWCE